jgi:hypothetical protein
LKRYRFRSGLVGIRFNSASVSRPSAALCDVFAASAAYCATSSARFGRQRLPGTRRQAMPMRR